jgi:hypothetical protein
MPPHTISSTILMIDTRVLGRATTDADGDEPCWPTL